MFNGCSNFNQDISGWNVSNVTNMGGMFRDAVDFNQDLSSWNITSVTNLNNFMANVTLSTSNYDALLIGWEAQNVQPDLSQNIGNSQFSAGAEATAKQALLDPPNNWIITDG